MVSTGTCTRKWEKDWVEKDKAPITAPVVKSRVDISGGRQEADGFGNLSIGREGRRGDLEGGSLDAGVPLPNADVEVRENQRPKLG